MPNIDYITFGERVQNARRRKHMTQRALAALCRVSGSHISDIERGEAKPSYVIVARLCDLLNIAEPDYQTVEGGEL